MCQVFSWTFWGSTYGEGMGVNLPQMQSGEVGKLITAHKYWLSSVECNNVNIEI